MNWNISLVVYNERKCQQHISRREYKNTSKNTSTNLHMDQTKLISIFKTLPLLYNIVLWVRLNFVPENSLFIFCQNNSQEMYFMNCTLLILQSFLTAIFKTVFFFCPLKVSFKSTHCIWISIQFQFRKINEKAINKVILIWYFSK